MGNNESTWSGLILSILVMEIKRTKNLASDQHPMSLFSLATNQTLFFIKILINFLIYVLAFENAFFIWSIIVPL